MRIFLIVIDSFGVGCSPDADKYGDEGSNTLRSLRRSEKLYIPNMERMGLYNIDGVERGLIKTPSGAYGRLQEKSQGKDTTTGHWEIAGVETETPLPLYPHGFPREIIEKFERETGRKVICNKPYSGTDVIRDYGEQHMKTGALIVYTSADSVFQIAAHEDIVPVEELYRYCRTARNILTGKDGVGRVIARPFTGDVRNGFVRTSRRHDFSLEPPGETMLDILQKHGASVVGIGKIYDIFAGRGLDKKYTSPTCSNDDGMEKTSALLRENFEGLVFVNLVETDMVYGHRRDADGYAGAVSRIDQWLTDFMAGMEKDDILMITGDHGCDPGFTKTTDHTREYIPLLIWGSGIKAGVNIGTRNTFADIGATIVDLLGAEPGKNGKSFKKDILI